MLLLEKFAKMRLPQHKSTPTHTHTQQIQINITYTSCCSLDSPCRRAQRRYALRLLPTSDATDSCVFVVSSLVGVVVITLCIAYLSHLVLYALPTARTLI